MEAKVRVKEILDSKDNFPVEGQAHVVGQAENGLYFFAWGPAYPYMSEVPVLDDPFYGSGILWFDRKYQAINMYKKAVRHAEGNGKMKLKHFDVSADNRTVLTERNILDAERHIVISFEIVDDVYRFIRIDPQTGTITVRDVPQSRGMDRDMLEEIAPDGKFEVIIPPGKWYDGYPSRYLAPDLIKK